MSDYYLSRDAFFAEQSGYAVFLDVKRDRYLALSKADTVRFLSTIPHVAGKPVRSDVNGTPSLDLDRGREELLAVLVREGILVQDPSAGRPLHKSEIITAKRDCQSSLREPPRIDPHHIFNVVRSIVVAIFFLKAFPIWAALKRVSYRKRKNRPRQHPKNARELVSVFNKLLPIFMASPNCLKGSLILSEFLALYEVYPEWVFAAKVEPFAAHCWLQEDGVVLNDTVEHIETFAPLMVV